jgi:hypothetical protein
MDIQLNFINQSNDQNNSDIVIFSKNVDAGPSELAVAWMVIQYCGQGDNHPFTYPSATQVGVIDAWGNHSPKLNAPPGSAFAVRLTASGDILAPAGPATYPTVIEVSNDLPKGAITACIFKNGAVFTQTTGLAPGQMTTFELKPTIWIGAVSQVEQGAVMNSAVVEQINTEIALLGLASADIIMTGGGSGPNAQPFCFTLQNAVLA